MALPNHVVKLGDRGDLLLPEDALSAIDVAPGDKVRITIDHRRNELRIDRFVDDLWAEATKDKPKKDFDDLLSEQRKRTQAAKDVFDRRFKPKEQE
jgi:bifunctional DNA-binding transcriptional regulator/antitoxin component of YhaV-PrlF toxin-antitoxin module